jgi:hypothetical protein
MDIRNDLLRMAQCLTATLFFLATPVATIAHSVVAPKSLHDLYEDARLAGEFRVINAVQARTNPAIGIYLLRTKDNKSLKVCTEKMLGLNQTVMVIITKEKLSSECPVGSVYFDFNDAENLLLPGIDDIVRNDVLYELDSTVKFKTGCSIPALLRASVELSDAATGKILDNSFGGLGSARYLSRNKFMDCIYAHNQQRRAQ